MRYFFSFFSNLRISIKLHIMFYLSKMDTLSGQQYLTYTCTFQLEQLVRKKKIPVLNLQKIVTNWMKYCKHSQKARWCGKSFHFKKDPIDSIFYILIFLRFIYKNDYRSVVLVAKEQILFICLLHKNNFLFSLFFDWRKLFKFTKNKKKEKFQLNSTTQAI